MWIGYNPYRAWVRTFCRRFCETSWKFLRNLRIVSDVDFECLCYATPLYCYPEGRTRFFTKRFEFSAKISICRIRKLCIDSKYCIVQFDRGLRAFPGLYDHGRYKKMLQFSDWLEDLSLPRQRFSRFRFNAKCIVYTELTALLVPM